MDETQFLKELFRCGGDRLLDPLSDEPDPQDSSKTPDAWVEAQVLIRLTGIHPTATEPHLIQEVMNAGTITPAPLHSAAATTARCRAGLGHAQGHHRRFSGQTALCPWTGSRAFHLKLVHPARPCWWCAPATAGKSPKCAGRPSASTGAPQVCPTRSGRASRYAAPQAVARRPRGHQRRRRWCASPARRASCRRARTARGVDPAREGTRPRAGRDDCVRAERREASSRSRVPVRVIIPRSTSAGA